MILLGKIHKIMPSFFKQWQRFGVQWDIYQWDIYINHKIEAASAQNYSLA